RPHGRDEDRGQGVGPGVDLVVGHAHGPGEGVGVVVERLRLGPGVVDRGHGPVVAVVEPVPVVRDPGPAQEPGEQAVVGHDEHASYVEADGVVRPGRGHAALCRYPPEPMDRLYFRQLLAGRDVARQDPLARQMVNFVYLIGDRETGEALVVDPAYDVAGILDVAAADDMRVTGALVTHYHPDHVGGQMMGYPIAGVDDLLEANPVPVHVQNEEAPWVQRVTNAGEGDLVRHESGD